MNTEDLARQIERANRRMVELRRAAGREEPSVWSQRAMTELSCALEELQVAEEELTLQNAELARANAEAEFERHRYHEIFMSSPFGQVVTDLRGMILDANRVACQLLGAQASGLTGKPLPLMVSVEERDRFIHWVAVLRDASHDVTVCAECGGSGEFQVQIAPRGPVFPCEFVAAPLVDRGGTIESIRWCLVDVSDRQRAREAERQLEEARRKDELVGAHREIAVDGVDGIPSELLKLIVAAGGTAEATNHGDGKGSTIVVQLPHRAGEPGDVETDDQVE